MRSTFMRHGVRCGFLGGGFESELQAFLNPNLVMPLEGYVPRSWIKLHGNDFHIQVHCSLCHAPPFHFLSLFEVPII